MTDKRYQCPRCKRSYTDEIDGKKGRFCTRFSAKLNDEEAKEANFVENWFGIIITRECKWVYRGWDWKCAGFRLR